MQRTSRDTSVWFDNDQKGTLKDRDLNKSIGPGLYQVSQTSPSVTTRASHSASQSSTLVGVLSDKQRKISWNTGSVPFGNGSARNLSVVRGFQAPGPNTYNTISVTGIKPQPLKGETPKSLQSAEYLKQQQSPSFKNNEPRIAVYTQEEKRLKDLLGPKPQPEFAIKLNNELLEQNQKLQNPVQGILITGNALTKQTTKLKEIQQIQEEQRELHNYVFATHKKNKLGPGQYDCQETQTKQRSQIARMSPEPRPKSPQTDQNDQFEKKLKMIRQFDGSAATIKKTTAVPNVPLLEQRIVLRELGDDQGKAKKAVFDYNGPRFAKVRERSPGPGKYDPTEPQYMLEGESQAIFGFQARRDDLLNRNLDQSPFVDPTSQQSPSPALYTLEQNPNSVTFTQPKQDFSQKPKQTQESFVFQSGTIRDPLQSVAQGAVKSPGPGSYIQDIGEPSNQQVPFSSNVPRFDYLKEHIADQVRLMKIKQAAQLTVVDQHVQMRREAHQKAKRLHKQIDQIKPNAAFMSQSKRMETSSDEQTLLSTQISSQAGQQMVIARSPLALIQKTIERSGQDEGYYQSYSPKNAMFLSTQPRFGNKESLRSSLLPGPGSYDQSKVTAASIFNETTQSVFKNTTGRMDDLKGYRGFQKHENQIGPGQYNVKQPFLRKTFNTTLPLGHFV